VRIVQSDGIGLSLQKTIKLPRRASAPGAAALEAPTTTTQPIAAMMSRRVEPRIAGPSTPGLVRRFRTETPTPRGCI
jgi:hypothetical protein